jgi:colanic acid/amylovoran biosynthesis protein
LSANKGAASMLWGVLDSLPAEVGPCDVAVLSTYPEEDARALEHDFVEIVSARPREIVFPMLPEAVMAWVLRRVGKDPAVVCRSEAMARIATSDVVLDLAGISFSDGRGVPTLGYNVLMSGIPAMTGADVVKCSQALGPFETWLNRSAARLVLRNMAAICARGEGSYRHVAALALGVPLVKAGDLAFLMRRSDRAVAVARELVDSADGYVVVSPSSVVDAYCRRVGIDYAGLMGRFTRRLVDEGHHVVVLAHSFRPSAKPSRMNDVPVCREVISRSGVGDRVMPVLGDHPPTVLRALIGRARTLVTSRFHAMISGLATVTPTVVVGWSHKYAEVMSGFEMQDFVLRFETIDDDVLWESYRTADSQDADLRARIASGLPAVTRQAEVNLDVIRDVLAANELA